MSVYECSVICTTCTQYDDAPVVLVEESTDHAVVGKDHHEKAGACWIASVRHLEAYPKHELEYRHATQKQREARARRGDDDAAARRAAMSKAALEATIARIDRRREQMQTKKDDA